MVLPFMYVCVCVRACACVFLGIQYNVYIIIFEVLCMHRIVFEVLCIHSVDDVIAMCSPLSESYHALEMTAVIIK